MTQTPDITPEAVERHIMRIDPHGYSQKGSLNDDTITMLRALAARLAEVEAERDAALVAIFECMGEIDAYIQLEYLYDHPVQERYRQRDYAANPARIFLRERPDALVKARATIANLKGEKDEW